MNDRHKQLKKIKTRLEQIEPILNKTFKTSKELNDHIKKNKKLYEEGKSLFEQIQQLEYELKTPEEKEEHDEYLRKLQLKSEGKSLI